VDKVMADADGWIHLAAVLGTQEAIFNPRPAAFSNIMGTLNVLESAARLHLPGAFISVGNHWMENTYSISKSTGERFVRMFNRERGSRVNIVRAMSAYGPRQAASAPYGPGPVRKIVPAFVCRALSGQPIELYGDGLQISDMIYVSDVARVLVRALEAAERGEVFDRAVEAGPAEHQAVRDIAHLVNRLVAEHTGVEVDIVHLPMRPGESPGEPVTADVSTLDLVGLSADDLVPVEEGMRRTVAHFVATEGSEWHRPGKE
jgi:UDP-glucose 4-epimerase